MQVSLVGEGGSRSPGTVPAAHCGGLSGCGAAAVGPWAREWRLPALECGLGGRGVSQLWSVGSGVASPGSGAWARGSRLLALKRELGSRISWLGSVRSGIVMHRLS